jgi:release factor glutamine methyltransferase
MELLPTGGRIVDVGTGSGAIALSIAHERPDAEVFATEISAEAIAWADKNRAGLGLSIELKRGDLFEGLPAGTEATFDVVVSNPPYVSPTERDSLPRDVVEHEPEVALFADGDGTVVIERLAREATRWLRPGGWIVMEIGSSQSESVTKILEATGYSEVFVRPDPAGLPRVAEGRSPE